MDCKNEIFRVLKNKNTLHGNDTIVLGGYKEVEIPLYLFKQNSSATTRTKNNSLIFSPNKNISVTLKINRKPYEYGVDRKKSYENFINYLAFAIDHSDLFKNGIKDSSLNSSVA